MLFIEKHHISKRCRNACPHHTQVAENMLQLMGNKVVMLTEKVDIPQPSLHSRQADELFPHPEHKDGGIELFTALFSAQACELSLHRPQRHDAQKSKK